MSRPALSSVAVLAVLFALCRPTHAQDDDEAELADEEGDGDEEGEGEEDDAPLQVAPKVGAKAPPAYARIDVTDVSIGLRDDYFAAITLDDDGTIYVATYDGRAYISRDNGVTFTEGIVVPEVRNFFGFAGQAIFLGSIRPGVDSVPSEDPGVGVRGIEAPSTQMLWGNVDAARGTTLGQFFYAGNLGLTGLLANNTGVYNPSIAFSGLDGYVGAEAERAAGAGEGVLGVGLSARAPRLSLLLALRGRTVPVISLARLLVTTGQRPIIVRRIIPDPRDKKHLYAATKNGLYESRDGGVAWMRIYAGATLAERGAYMVAFDPEDANRLYLGTDRGMYQSDNGGLSWSKNTAVPEISVKNVIIDPNDPRIVYAAGYGGVFRSSDRGKTFALAYYSTQARLNDVLWLTLDPFDSDVAYIATGEGLLKTEKAREARSVDFRMLAPTRTQGLVILQVLACTRHRGHLYASTRADLPAINYGTDGPEVLMIESWDGGSTWRDLLNNRTMGDLQWFWVDPRDPDTIWVAFSRAMLRVGRARPDAEEPDEEKFDLSLAGPSMTSVIARTLRHHEVELRYYQDRVDLLRERTWVPNRLILTASAGRRRAGGDVDDNQFAADRLLRVQSNTAWQVMMWAAWKLPSFIYDHQAVAMQRVRVQAMNDEIRNRMINAIHRNYGELQRLRVRAATGGDRPLYVRATERVRIQMLEAVVDLASGGYLTEQQRKENR